MLSCGYDLEKAPNYTALIEKVGDKPMLQKSIYDNSAAPRMFFSVEAPTEQDYASLSMFLFYKR